MGAAELRDSGVIIENGIPVPADNIPDAEARREKTMAYRIMGGHGTRDGKTLRLKFDALASHDITYVNIIQTARASGMREFIKPYVMTNCHNSLCAVGGTVNEDDHFFGLSAAKRYGGIFVPANMAVIHQFLREKIASCGAMILGSDSHTRCGHLGAMGVGEGGGEIVRQLLGDTWDSEAPRVTLVWVTGKPKRGVGPHDAALALTAALFPGGRVKNRVLEFAGPGISGLSADFRSGIDIMTTETGALSSIWETDGVIRRYYETVGRPSDFREMKISEGAYYDSAVFLDMSQVECMIALPFHPSKAVPIHTLQNDAGRILAETDEECSKASEMKMCLSDSLGGDGLIRAEQGVIVGCAGGTFENICEAAAILNGGSVGNGYFGLSVYPSSVTVQAALIKCGAYETLLRAGAVLKPAFCGPCFGAGDTPANGTLSIRHATRNFANREGSKPSCGQSAAVALMDARSIAATAANGGILTAATDIDYDFTAPEPCYDGSVYEKRCYFGFGKAEPETELRLGPNIADWPEFSPLEENLLIKICAEIRDEVTTTDELIPSGETSSYRSNPEALAEFTLSRRVPEYVRRAKIVRNMSAAFKKGKIPEEAANALASASLDGKNATVGSCIFALKPGDGSAREQAASCQRVLGGRANICREYATKRYRSNCISWGIIPFTAPEELCARLRRGDWIAVPGVRSALLSGEESFRAVVISNGEKYETELFCEGLTDGERRILADGCLMNSYKNRH